MPKEPARECVVMIRLEVVDPCPGVAYALQRGRSELDQRQVAGKQSLEFSIEVVVRPGRTGQPDVYGPHVQGRPGERFVYVCSGTLAEQPGTCWTRRAKVFVDEIATLASERQFPVKPLRAEARMHGRAGDGGPACAKVPLLEGWRFVE